ncbi:MAG: hypothetical protein L6R39_004197 [Caloplaca ligustica]|nr:MAG: hypothetical protein L6R39_004197 [Caloplaca ligustica]
MRVPAHLFSLGVRPSAIILSGDSAGGNLALAFMRYLHDHDGLFPTPAALLLWNPRLDLATNAETIRDSENYPTDYLPPAFLSWGARLHPTSLGVPTWIQVSGREVFRDDCVRYFNALQKIKGNDVELYEISDASHNVILTANLVDRKEYAKQAAENAADFLKSRVLL